MDDAPQPTEPQESRPVPGAPRPGPPRPGPGRARPGPVAAAAAPAAAVAPESESVAPAVDPSAPPPESWGRVADDGTVFVRSRDGSEREVGQWPGGDPAEALALYVRRYEGLAVEVELLERRVRQEALSPDEAHSTISGVREQVVQAQAVGDLGRLADRLDGLAPRLEEQRERRRAARVAKQEQARVVKEQVVAEAERLATSQDWRAGADGLRELMETWKAQPRLDKPADDALWRRFSSARTTYTRRRRQHFAELYERRDQAKAVKDTLAAEAESIADSTDWGPTAGRFRDLMKQWKAAGPAPRKEEEALWQRFRGAQDRFFQARDADGARTDAELAANAEVKAAILGEAEQLVPVTDVAAARTAFRPLADRWEAAGKVPRDQVRDLEGRMRAVESALQAAENERWQRSNPEGRARAEATVTQLESSLADLRAQAAKAEDRGDAKRLREAREAIEARESWLVQARQAVADFTP